MRTHLLWIAAFALGCHESFTSDQGQLDFDDDGVLDDADDNGFGNDGPVLVGTQLCPEIACGGCGDLSVEEAFDSTVSGPATLSEDGCLTFTGAGTVTWSFEPTAAGSPYELVSDFVEFEVVDAQDVSATLYHWFEDHAQAGVDDGTITTTADALPEDWLPAQGEPLRLIANTPTTLDLMLWGADDAQVGWSFDIASLDTQGDVQASLGDSPSSKITLQGQAGASGSVVANVGDGTWELGTVEAVSEGEAASIEVIGFSWADGQDEVVGPVAARAVIRDGDGNPLFGAPVSWKVTSGLISIQPAGLGSGEDYVSLTDECRPPSKRDGEHKLRLQATYREMKDSVLFTWDESSYAASYTDDELAQMDEEWVRPENCKRGCGCSHVTPVGSGMLGILLGMGALARRRDRA